MQFGKFDFTILIVMLIAVVFMSFVFPSLGLGGSEVSESEFPELNVSNSTYDFAGEFPRRPSTPGEGVLVYINNSADVDERSVWLDRTDQDVGSDGTQVFLAEESDQGKPQISLIQFEGGTETDRDEANFTETGEKVNLKVDANETFELVAELTGQENLGAENATLEARFEVRVQPADTHWTQRVPVLGGAFSAATQTASTVAWIGVVMIWFATYLVTILTNVFITVINLTVFLFSLANWLIITYTGIVSSASSFASVIVAIPGVLLSTMLGKIVVIFIEVTWLG